SAAPTAAAPAPEKKAAPAQAAAPAPAPAAPKSAPASAVPSAPAPAVPAAREEDEHARSSPLVRKIAREHNVDLSEVSGTGLGGRITKQDILAFIENQEAGAPSKLGLGGEVSAPAPQPAPAQAPRPAPAAIPGDLVPMSQMRKIIAQRMIESR